jgi:hypothetical protein
MKTSKMPKGKDKQFARGGATPMFGAGTRTKSAYPAGPQRPGQTSGQAASGKTVRPAKRIAKVSSAANPGGGMGGSAGASQPRRPAA